MFKLFKKHSNKSPKVQRKQNQVKKQAKKARHITNQRNQEHQIQDAIQRGRKQSRQTGHNYEVSVDKDNNVKLVVVDNLKQQNHYTDLLKKQELTQFLFDYPYVMNSIHYAIGAMDYRAFNHFINLIVMNSKIDQELPATMHDLTQVQYEMSTHVPTRYNKKLIDARARINFIFYKHNLMYVNKLTKHRTSMMKHMVSDIYEDCNYSYAPMWNKSINQACQKAMEGKTKDIDVITMANKYMSKNKKHMILQMKNVYAHDLQSESEAQKNQIYIHKLAVHLDNEIKNNNTKSLKKTLTTFFNTAQKHPELERDVVNSVMSVYESYKLNQMPKDIFTELGQFFMKLDSTAMKEIRNTKNFKLINQDLIGWLQNPGRNELLYQSVYQKIKHPKFFPPRNKEIAIKLIDRMLNYINKHKSTLKSEYIKQLKTLHRKYDKQIRW